VRAHFSAWHRDKDKESARRRGNVQPSNPAVTFMHSRLGRFLIKQDVAGVAKILQRLDWLGDEGDEREAEPLALPAGPWRTATVPQLARLGLLRYRPARSGHAELLRAGDVLVPAAVTKQGGVHGKQSHRRPGQRRLPPRAGNGTALRHTVPVTWLSRRAVPDHPPLVRAAGSVWREHKAAVPVSAVMSFPEASPYAYTSNHDGCGAG